MEIKEGVATLATFVHEDQEECSYEPEATTWKANLDGDSKTLGRRLRNKPDASRKAELSATNWPSQAHHIIPHDQLAKHGMKNWLKKGTMLWADTQYDVDHANNGMWMPFASKLPEWKTGSAEERRELMLEIMRLAKLQIHQGRHSMKNAYGIGIAPYKARVASYLDKIRDATLSHYAGERPCKDCQGKAKAGRFPPRNNTVVLVDMASGHLEREIRNGSIFVSKIAAELEALVRAQSEGAKLP